MTCFLRNGGDVLLLRRSSQVGSYPGCWGAVAGHVERGPEAAARREIAEETGLSREVRFVRRGDPFTVDDEALGKRWLVHPYLFDCTTREVRLDWESTEAEWVPATEILEREVVPDLWRSYSRVAPTVETLASDREHGAAYLSLRALEVVRDRAAVLAHGKVSWPEAWEDLARLAERLLEARPSMSVVTNRIHRVMQACRSETEVGAVARIAQAAVARAIQVDEAAASRAIEWIAGRRVLTLSRSSTVSTAILAADPPPKIILAESRPGGEGVAEAEALARAGIEVTLVADAAMDFVMESEAVELVLVGADSLLPSGAIVNKTGTKLAALAAHARGIPFYAVASSDKLLLGETVSLEAGDPQDLYRGEASFQCLNPLFEITPARLITAIVTEEGALDPDRVGNLAAELEGSTEWKRR